jgi:hypothetical protein
MELECCGSLACRFGFSYPKSALVFPVMPGFLSNSILRLLKAASTVSAFAPNDVMRKR